MTTVHDLENHSMDSWQETLTASSNVAIVSPSWTTDEAKAVEVYPFLADCPQQFMGGGFEPGCFKTLRRSFAQVHPINLHFVKVETPVTKSCSYP